MWIKIALGCLVVVLAFWLGLLDQLFVGVLIWSVYPTYKTFRRVGWNKASIAQYEVFTDNPIKTRIIEVLMMLVHQAVFLYIGFYWALTTAVLITFWHYSSVVYGFVKSR